MLLEIGSSLFSGRYRVDALVGQGATSEVYCVTHLTLNHRYAAKVLRKGVDGNGSTIYDDYRERFRLEAQLGARVIHPNLVRVYDFVDQPEGLILLMDFALAGSLAERQDRLSSGVYPPLEEVVGTAIDVASALDAIHKKDIVHRDLKPSNILLETDGHAKVADLGLAQVKGGPSQRSRLSSPVPHPGTPSYMSPEQASTTAYLSPASDNYALGLILFELVTGRVYRNVRPGTLASTLRAGVPTTMDKLLIDMLSSDPESRPFDGEEVLSRLREIQIQPQWRSDSDWLRLRQSEIDRSSRIAAEAHFMRLQAATAANLQSNVDVTVVGTQSSQSLTRQVVESPLSHKVSRSAIKSSVELTDEPVHNQKPPHPRPSGLTRSVQIALSVLALVSLSVLVRIIVWPLLAESAPSVTSKPLTDAGTSLPSIPPAATNIASQTTVTAARTVTDTTTPSLVAATATQLPPTTAPAQTNTPLPPTPSAEPSATASVTSTKTRTPRPVVTRRRSTPSPVPTRLIVTPTLPATTVVADQPAQPQPQQPSNPQPDLPPTSPPDSQPTSPP